MRRSSFLVEGAAVITVDGDNRIFRDGAILSEDGEIVAVGKSEEVRREAGRVEVRISGPHKVVIPGLVNTHVHPAQALLRGLVPDSVRLLEWLRDWVWPLQGNFSPEDGAAASRLTALEMLRTGTTSFLATSMHMRYGVDDAVRIFHEAGLRGAIGVQTMDMPGYALEQGILHSGMISDRDASLRLFKELHSKWHGVDDRVWIWLSPRTPGAVSDDLLREIAYLKREYNSGVTMHLAEVKEDVEYFKSRGTTPARFVESLGLTGSRSVFVHCVWFGEEDIGIFARTGTSVSHNPGSNMKLASGIAPVARMLRAGVNVALGTDGGPSNDTYDMIREMRLAALLQRVGTGDPRSLSAIDAIRMATLNGARAMGIDGLVGSLEVGKRADVVVIDARRPHLTPDVVSLSNLAYSASGQDVEHVFVDGSHIVDEGKVLTLDEGRVLEDAQRLAEDLYRRVKGEPWMRPAD